MDIFVEPFRNLSSLAVMLAIAMAYTCFRVGFEPSAPVAVSELSLRNSEDAAELSLLGGTVVKKQGMAEVLSQRIIGGKSSSIPSRNDSREDGERGIKALVAMQRGKQGSEKPQRTVPIVSRFVNDEPVKVDSFERLLEIEKSVGF